MALNEEFREDIELKIKNLILEPLLYVAIEGEFQST